MAALAGARPVDTYGILQAFGHDCAGAIMVLPDGEQPGGRGSSGYSPMTPRTCSGLSTRSMPSPGRGA